MSRRILSSILMVLLMSVVPATVFAQDGGGAPDRIVVDEWRVDAEGRPIHCVGDGMLSEDFKQDGGGGTHYAIHQSLHVTCTVETGEASHDHEIFFANFRVSEDFTHGVYNTVIVQGGEGEPSHIQSHLTQTPKGKSH